MPSAKRRLIRAGVKYLLTHPRSRLTRFVVRFVLRKLSRRITASPVVAAIPPVRGSRLGSVAAVALVAGGLVFGARRSRRDRSRAPVPSEGPAPTAAASPEYAPATTTMSASPQSEAVAPEAPRGDEGLVARVEAELFDGSEALRVEVEANAGVITLRGPVADEAAEERYVRQAERVEGVKAVQSELQAARAEPGPPAS